ncbi:hypothetical protein [Amycolatopsis regifaucium]|uniref:Uncharacterized protein n=1 Tax=Amycolatopsis regifaucium TaxID=546365 RepID=A0A154MG16_9PSEU|nr:hypothetical protein [Amycolatopsis regifaucium]KZB83120.1 hypothetical protein AVL48_36495 [Amycolatopsis regifaucium]OKA03225.1 hypothetical protein ATP06_0237505 [Amycolatopsis regifaucium]SFJ46584.1 hypothetical protein SAMN04489731_12219 [Amycolatopsis regifaucium]
MPLPASTRIKSLDRTQPGDAPSLDLQFRPQNALGVSRTVVNGATTTYTDGKLTAVTDTAGGHHNAITDNQGSVLALVNDTGQLTARYDYTPYGAAGSGPASLHRGSP